MTNIKNMIVKIIIVFVLVQVVFAIQNISEASWWSDLFSSADSFLDDGKVESMDGKIDIKVDNDTMSLNLPTADKMNYFVSNLWGIVVSLGVVVTVIVGVVLGIKFMLASADDKAKIKESLVPYVVGCIVIFGAFAIWKVCLELLGGIA